MIVAGLQKSNGNLPLEISTKKSVLVKWESRPHILYIYTQPLQDLGVMATEYLVPMTITTFSTTKVSASSFFLVIYAPHPKATMMLSGILPFTTRQQ